MRLRAGMHCIANYPRTEKSVRAAFAVGNEDEMGSSPTSNPTGRRSSVRREGTPLGGSVCMCVRVCRQEGGEEGEGAGG